MRYQLPSQLTGDMAILTASNRLARHLRQQYAHLQMAKAEGCAVGKSLREPAGERVSQPVWETPTIVPLQSWLLTLLRDWSEETLELDAARISDKVPQLLTSEQTGLLWERVIDASRWSEGLLQHRPAIKQAQAAWRLMCEWNLSHQQLDTLHGDDDYQAFADWLEAYQQQLASNHWLDPLQVPQFLIEHLEHWHSDWPTHLLLAGFGERTPQLQLLLDHLQSLGVTYQSLPEKSEVAKVSRLDCSSTDEELQRITAWVAKHLALREKEYTAPRIAIAAPDVNAVRLPLQRMLEQTLAPSRWLDPAVPADLLNVSLGKPLTDYPVVQLALTWLQLLHRPVPLPQLSTLLRSPFSASSEEEHLALCELEVLLRNWNVNPCDCQQLLRVIRATQFATSLAEWSTQLEQQRQAIKEAPSRQSLGQWGQTFRSALKHLPWPGHRPLNSAEHQQLQAFSERIQALSQGEMLLRPVGMQQALQLLRRWCQELLFQPENRFEPVQLMGLMEAATLEFDALWLMGMNDTVLPQPPSPNPFLAKSLLRAHRMPGSGPDRELEFARNLMALLLKAAPEVRISYAKSDGANDYLPSPLIKSFEALPVDHDDAVVNSLESSSTTGCETIVDTRGVAMEEGDTAQGGTGLFADQAACPFRAFARHRLRLQELAEISDAPDASIRGSLLHEVLERVWRELGDQQALLALSEQQRIELLQKHTNAALIDYEEHHPLLRQPAYVELESRRLVPLLDQFLQLEAQRAPFKVRACEERTQVRLGPIECRTIVDRIDQDDSGKWTIIDYKTGQPSLSDWFDERLLAPQLPLYATQHMAQVAGVVYGQIRSGDTRFLGVTETGDQFPGVNTLAKTRAAPPDLEWTQMLSQWQSQLQLLAQEFASGEASVLPVNPPQTCSYCEFDALCRINEKLSASAWAADVSDPYFGGSE